MNEESRREHFSSSTRQPTCAKNHNMATINSINAEKAPVNGKNWIHI
jgi:hypothetical protein